VRGKGSGVISSAVFRQPNAIVSNWLDWTQHHLRNECCVFWAARNASSRNFTTPDENMELTKSSVLGGAGKPRDADSAGGGLKDATRRRAMLFDRPFQLFDALEHTFGCQRVQEGGDGTLNHAPAFCARRCAPLGSTGASGVFHVRFCGDANFAKTERLSYRLSIFRVHCGFQATSHKWPSGS